MIFILSVIALCLSLGGNILINKQKKCGFVVWIMSNIAWIIVNLLGNPNYPQILMYCAYAVLNVLGWRTWTQNEQNVIGETNE